MSMLIEKEEDLREKLLVMSVDDLDFSVRTWVCLKRAEINTVGQILEKSYAELLEVKNLRPRNVVEIINKLASYNLYLLK